MIVAKLLFSLFFSAFFSGIEIAFVSANKLRVELEKNRSFGGRIVANFLRKPTKFIGTTLVGNNIMLVIFSGAAVELWNGPIELWLNSKGVPAPEVWAMLLVTLISTPIVLLFGEFIPKIVFRIDSVKALTLFAPILRFIYWLVLPVVTFVLWLSKIILKWVFRMNIEDQEPVFSRMDLQHLLLAQVATKEESEEIEVNADLFGRAMELTKINARQCMVPRPEVQAMSVDTPMDELKRAFLEGGFSRLLVYDDSVDNILGYVHHQSMLSNPTSIKSILFSLPVVPETMPASDILNLLTRERKNIAWVVDEFGGTAGIITMEDILEEIFGEIEDEHDDQEFVEQQLSASEYIFSSRLEVDYLNDTYELGLPTGEYETLGGLIVNTVENIPEMRETVEIGRFLFTILNVSDTKIEMVKVAILDLDEDEMDV